MVGQQYNPYQGYPLKQVSDQVWDVYGPTPDYLIAQQFGMRYPNNKKFSLDAFFGAPAELRGPFAQAYSAGKGDLINTYAQLQSADMRKQMAKQIGQDEWDQIASTGDLRMLRADNAKERDAAAIDYYQRGIEDLMAQGAPTNQRNQQWYDQNAMDMGGMPYPGAMQQGGGMGGGGQGYGGQGGGDRMARLAAGGQVDLAATPEGTPFGQGLEEIGEATGRDRLGYENGARIAVLGGRKFRLPDTMMGPSGVNPAYQRALGAVTRENRAERQGRSRQRAESRSQQRKDDEKRAGFAGVWKAVTGMGTPIKKMF
jgi:hypothetical protein